MAKTSTITMKFIPFIVVIFWARENKIYGNILNGSISNRMPSFTALDRKCHIKIFSSSLPALHVAALKLPFNIMTLPHVNLINFPDGGGRSIHPAEIPLKALSRPIAVYCHSS